MIPLLILLEFLLELPFSPSDIQPGVPIGVSWKFINVGVDRVLDGNKSKSGEFKLLE
jgi:hypothetical protein